MPGLNYPQHNATAQTCTAPAQPIPADAGPTVAVCFLPLSYTLSAAVSPPMPDPCAGVPANAYCPATAPNTPLALPNTARAPSPLTLTALIGGLGAVALGMTLLQRRRRRRPA